MPEAELARTPRSESDASGGWAARLELELAPIGGRTAIARRSQFGPLTVQRPFHPEPGGAAHVVVLHPPGGVVSGDRLELEVGVASGAQALLTTPAATKFYRSDGRAAHQSVELEVRAGGELDWLPQENIVFGGSRARLRTRVRLEPGARFIGWDILCLGRPASGDHFARGEVRQAFELWQGDRPLYIERSAFEAGDAVRAASWGFGGASVSGTLVCPGAGAEACEAVRQAVPELAAGELVSVTAKREVLLCRYRGSSTERAKAVFGRAWSVLRPLLFGRQAHPPRIWLT